MKTYLEDRKISVLSLRPFTELHFERSYSVTSLALMFFLLSMAGWMWEVLIHLVEDGLIINRGLLFGPWLPIYGTGGVLILKLLKKWRNRPFCTLGLIMLLCGVIEYVTSLALEFLFGAKWWDYSDMLFNFQGRVCLEGLLIFGLGGIIFIYVAAPKLDDFFLTIQLKTKRILCLLFTAFFLVDLIRSFLVPNMGFGITT